MSAKSGLGSNYLNATQHVDNSVHQTNQVMPLFSLGMGNSILVMGDKVLLRMPQKGVSCSARFFCEVQGGSVVFVLEDNANATLFQLDSEVYCEHYSDGDVVTFTGKVERFDVNPFPRLLLSCPYNIRKHDSVREVRVNVDRDVLLHNMSGHSVKDAIAGKLLNLSKSGGLVVSQSAVGFVGDEMSMLFMLPYANNLIKFNLIAKVRHVRHITNVEGNPQFYSGLQFANVTDKDSLYIKSYMIDILR